MTTDTHSYDGTCTFAAVWGKVQLIILLTKQLTLLFHKSTVHQWHAAVRIGTYEMIRTPRLVQRRYKRTSAYISFALYSPCNVTTLQSLFSHSVIQSIHVLANTAKSNASLLLVGFNSWNHALHVQCAQSAKFSLSATNDCECCMQCCIYII